MEAVYMENPNSIPVQKITRELARHRATFLAVFVVVFVVSYGLLGAVGLVPELAEERTSVTNSAQAGASSHVSLSPGEILDDTPRRIVIDTIGVDAEIINPVSRDINVLDQALRHGVVHYPGSGDLEDHSNMFLFGHSSHLPVVHNELYRVFNDLSKLEEGDEIRVQAHGYEYRYRVSSVELVDADEALVELSNREKKLTLATCNSFGNPSDRFVVEADFVERVALGA